MKILIFIFVAFINVIHAKPSFQNTPLLSCNPSLRSSIDEPRLSRANYLVMKPYKELKVQVLKDEIWKDIPEFDGIYAVSNLGRIKTNDYVRFYSRKSKIYGSPSHFVSRTVKGQIRKQNVSDFGYLYTHFRFKDGRKNRYIHRYVAKMFVDNPDGKPFVNHKDGNKLNNHFSNLEWCTSSENVSHAFKNGLKKPSYTCYNHQRGKSPRAMKVKVIESGKEYDCIKDLLDGEKISKHIFDSRIGIKYLVLTEYSTGTPKAIVNVKGAFRK